MTTEKVISCHQISTHKVSSKSVTHNLKLKFNLNSNFKFKMAELWSNNFFKLVIIQQCLWPQVQALFQFKLWFRFQLKFHFDLVSVFFILRLANGECRVKPMMYQVVTSTNFNRPCDQSSAMYRLNFGDNLWPFKLWLHQTVANHRSYTLKNGNDCWRRNFNLNFNMGVNLTSTWT